jgi:hypothetical protein
MESSEIEEESELEKRVYWRNKVRDAMKVM